ncbi:hypothetical protein VDGD_21189 [Verticillium dahliae]|nr:hypothetical protein VDGD_21189 [Verticillium dahliae]
MTAWFIHAVKPPCGEESPSFFLPSPPAILLLVCSSVLPSPESAQQGQPVPSVSRRSFIRAPARAFRDEEARGSRRFARPNGGDLSRTPNVGRDPGTRLHRMDRAGEVAQQQTGKREDRGCGERESDGGGGGDGGFAAAFSSASRPTAVDLAR